jgi:hypothetical protein
MIDPDLTHPNDRLSGQVRHWLQPGLVFSDGGSEGWIAKTTESAVTEYLECAPGPPVSCCSFWLFARSVLVVLVVRGVMSDDPPWMIRRKRDAAALGQA